MPFLAAYKAKDEYVGKAIATMLTLFFDSTAWIWQYTQPELYKELEGIVAGINDPDFTVAHAVYTNACYEIVAWCTSIIAKQANGEIIHARNLDYGFEDLMRALTFRAHYKQNGEFIFDAVMFAGVAGVYTGEKEKAFSISQDTRSFDKNPLGLVENFLMLYAGFTQNSMLIRQTLTKCNNYDCAFNHLAYKPMPSYGYNIVAGTKGDEGAVISRNRFGAAHIDKLDSANGKWFLVQTNSDEWKPDGYQTGCTDRCAAATASMNAVGQANINLETIRSKVLLVYPVLNEHTLYNTEFDPKVGYIETDPEDYTPSAADLAGPYKNDQPADMKTVLTPVHEAYCMFRPVIDPVLHTLKMIGKLTEFTQMTMF